MSKSTSTAKVVDRCVDGGHCFMMVGRNLPACKRSCSISHAYSDRALWRNIQRQAQEGIPASQEVVDRARRAGLA